MLDLHLMPDGIRCLDACLNGVIDAHGIKTASDGSCKVFKDSVTLGLRLSQFIDNILILCRMLILEAEVLQFTLDGIQAQAIGQGSIDVERLAGNLVLFVLCLRT